MCNFFNEIFLRLKFSLYNKSQENGKSCGTWINFYSEFFSLLSKPLNDVTESDNIISMIVHRKAFNDRNWNSGAGSKNRKLVFGYRRVERRTLLLPIWNELRQSGRLEASSGQNVSADGGRFFDHTNAEFFLTGLTWKVKKILE